MVQTTQYYLSQIQSSRSGRYTVYVGASTSITFSKIEWDIYYEIFDSTPPTINYKNLRYRSRKFYKRFYI